MGEFFLSLFRELYAALCSLAVDFFIWLFEWVFWVLNEIFSFVYDLLSPLGLALLDKMGAYVPSGVIDNIITMFEWLEYVDSWVPFKFGIGLFLAYYAIRLCKTIVRFIFICIGLGRASV